MNTPIYSSKSLKHEVTAPVHGQAGWRIVGGCLTEFTYCLTSERRTQEIERWVPEWKLGWLLVTEFLSQRDRVRFRRQQFYAGHPHLIQEKIRAKRILRGTYDRLLDRRISA